MNKAEQDAVRVVADRFFPIGDDGLRHNRRASEELVEAAPAIEAARANGKKGGRPRKETQQKPTGFSAGNPEGTQSEPGSKAPHSSDNSSSLRSEESARKRAPARPEDVAEQVWADWLALRKAKRAPVSDTTVAEARREADKAHLPLQRFLEIWVGRGSQGLQADWLKPHELAHPPGDPIWRAEQRQRTQQAAPGVAAGAPADQFFIDVEARRVPARTLG